MISSTLFSLLCEIDEGERSHLSVTKLGTAKFAIKLQAAA